MSNGPPLSVLVQTPLLACFPAAAAAAILLPEITRLLIFGRHRSTSGIKSCGVHNVGLRSLGLGF